MIASTSSERFHSLDATRACALLLGVVFHAVWSFVPAPMGAPVVDVSVNRFFDWFFFASHTFRMQLFFLIAGFFAHIICHRKGFGYFAMNRLSRIVVPLILGWLILFLPHQSGMAHRRKPLRAPPHGDPALNPLHKSLP